MNTREALALFEKHNTREIRVRSRAGIEYLLNADIVEGQQGTDGDGFVYGMRLTRYNNLKFRNRAETRWFNLKNVTFVEAA